MNREPAVAGQFYPADTDVLRADVEGFLAAGAGVAPPEVSGERAIALVVPHAGYMYSGPIAGAVYASAGLPRDLIILCPNHTGLGLPIAVMDRGAWSTPLGDAPINEALADEILRSCPGAEIDERAHCREHSLEVQLPFLRVKLGDFSFVPICVGTLRLDDLTDLGHGLARVIRETDGDVSIIISSDMSHYIPADEAKTKDMLAIEQIRRLDPEGLHRVVREHGISMCGIAPAVAGLTAAKDVGARAARLIAYGTSGDASGDYDRVVAYAGLAVT